MKGNYNIHDFANELFVNGLFTEEFFYLFEIARISGDSIGEAYTYAKDVTEGPPENRKRETMLKSKYYPIIYELFKMGHKEEVKEFRQKYLMALEGQEDLFDIVER